MEKKLLKHNRLMFVFILLLLLFGVGIFSHSFFIPRYIEKTILPELGRQMSSTLSGRVYSIGFSTADFGDVILGDTQNPALSIGSIHADYSFPSLLKKKLGHVTINGFSLHLSVSNGRLIIPGFDLDRLTSSQVDTDRQPSIPINPPFAPEKLHVSNGLVTISKAGTRLLVPFDLQLNRRPGEDRRSVYDYILLMQPQGEKIILSGTVDLPGNRSTMTLIIDSLDLSSFSSFIQWEKADLHSGMISIKGEADIEMLPFQLLSANLNIDPGLLHFGKTPVQFGQITPDTSPAIYLEIKNDEEQWLLKAQGFIREPLQASLELHGSIIRAHDKVKSSGNVVFKKIASPAPKNHDRTYVFFKNNHELHGGFVFTFDKYGSWKASLEGPDQKQVKNQASPFQVEYGKLYLQSEIPFLDVQGQGTAEAHEVRLSLAVPKMQARYDGVEISIPQVNLQASHIKKEAQGLGWTSRSDVSLRLDGAKFKKKNLNGNADIFLQGKIKPHFANGNFPMQAEGKITVANAAINMRDSGFKLDTIEGDIPWAWPPVGRKMTGKIKAPQISWKDVNLGSFETDITLLEMLYSLNGSYRSALLKDFVANVSGTAKITKTAMSGDIVLQSDITPFTAINLGVFDPSLENSYFSGDLGLDSFFNITDGKLKGWMQFKLQNGKYEFPEKKYSINKIGFSMLLPSLPDLRTAPAQTLHFAEASMGKLAFSNGKLVWQLESMESIFLEEGVVQWAGGRVFTSAVRISPEMKKGFIVPLFCDRLRLTEILQQFGVHNAAGEGTVSGRIPLELGKGAILFKDGFLYSSPGQGGSIKVAAFDLLAEGIPKNTPQFAQVDFAAEALKNFQYNWVKLLLDTQDEDLVLQMQMDGKPLKSLPFKYDSKTGLLQRIESAGPGIKQPIRLDVNFRLPLNRFLGYSGKIQDILKNIK